MHRLIRLLIIYTATISTLLLVITFLSMRGSIEQNKKAEATIDSLKQELSKITAYQESAKEIIQNLNSLKSEMAPLAGSAGSGPADNADKKVLGESNQASDSSGVTSGFVTINDKKWQTVDVYESNSYSSKVVAKIEFDKTYRYLKKEGSWYQIVLPKTETSGWVAGRFLKEIGGNGLEK